MYEIQNKLSLITAISTWSTSKQQNMSATFFSLSPRPNVELFMRRKVKLKLYSELSSSKFRRLAQLSSFVEFGSSNTFYPSASDGKNV